MYSLFSKVFDNVEDSPHKRVLYITQEHIDNCIPDDSKECAICKAAKGTSEFQENIEIEYTETIKLDGIRYKATRELRKWQCNLIDERDKVVPIRILFNDKRGTAKIFKG